MENSNAKFRTLKNLTLLIKLQKYKPIVEKKRKTPSAVFETQLGKSPKEIHSSKIKKLKKKERNILLKSVKLRKDIDVMTH